MLSEFSLLDIIISDFEHVEIIRHICIRWILHRFYTCSKLICHFSWLLLVNRFVYLNIAFNFFSKVYWLLDSFLIKVWITYFDILAILRTLFFQFLFLTAHFLGILLGYLFQRIFLLSRRWIWFKIILIVVFISILFFWFLFLWFILFFFLFFFLFLFLFLFLLLWFLVLRSLIWLSI